MAKPNEAPSGISSVSLINTGTTIKGDIVCSGDLRIDGQVEGKVEVKGKVVIGSAGRVEGDVICHNGDISGHMHGTVSVSEMLALKSSSVVRGEIVTKRLSIELGADFTGTCTMGAADNSGSLSSVAGSLAE